MMIGLGLSWLPDGPFWILLFLAIKVVASGLIAYFARRKGYSFWGFFVVSALLDPITSILLLLIIPARTAGDEAIAARS